MKHLSSTLLTTVMAIAMTAAALGQDTPELAEKLGKENKELSNQLFAVQNQHRKQTQQIREKTEKLEKLRLQLQQLQNPTATGSSQAVNISNKTGTGVIPESFIEKTSPHIVVIEGDKGSGTGFLCVVDGVVWVYTAAHVLSGNAKLAVRDSRGNRYSKFDYMESAEGVDLVRLRPTNQKLKGLEITSPSEAPKVGDRVVAVGNSRGAGSLSLEAGVVKNINHTMWEVSNDIIPGNSGGPILDLKSGKVTGIVTHLIMKRGRRVPGVAPQLDVKRFAARLDREWEWERMPVSRFVKEWQYIQKMDKDSEVAWATTFAIISHYEEPADKSRRGIMAWRQQMSHAANVIKENGGHFSVQRTKQWMKDFQGNYHNKDAVNKARSVIDTNINSIRLNGKEPKTSHFIWFHRETYKEVLALRKEILNRSK